MRARTRTRVRPSARARLRIYSSIRPCALKFIVRTSIATSRLAPQCLYIHFHVLKLGNDAHAIIRGVKWKPASRLHPFPEKCIIRVIMMDKCLCTSIYAERRK